MQSSILVTCPHCHDSRNVPSHGKSHGHDPQCQKCGNFLDGQKSMTPAEFYASFKTGF